ncbi:cGMP-dependent protein kinase, isozyme 1 [Anastrepha ludens]|uniref:cGMP-dependent protein kinase, isozyme 1 n=1 Tax=Anastrepha ludens TaxID=28586 RepID=UPI0023B08E09|nr:cGMP-dependent protein kinase, isozyme 1 [Anastrepha ludens]XP_053957664.1 cGMP-dependent protein kinase, isozyme 1 [Anastrepha ludens]XP_053957665.1 cGMP-dependent protein kinase, isozyme 1 [Anastrepha ludens]
MHTTDSDLQHQQILELSPPLKAKENLPAVLDKMITDTPKEAKPKPAVRFGISRSQDEESTPTLLEVEAPPHLGRVSPLLSTSLRSYGSNVVDYQNSSQHSAISTTSTIPRATNLRLKFRKSHTCGSLFANCNCSSPPAMPQPAHAIANGSSTTSQHLHAGRSSYAAAPCQFNFSISPTNTDLSSHSASTQYTSSGIYSLSTQTSSATSAQLSRDESMNVSFDWCGGDGAARSNSLDSGVSTSGGQSATLPHRKHSPVSFRLASVTENENTSLQTRSSAKSLQVPGTVAITDAAIAAPTVSTAISPTVTRKNERKAKRFFQSYSHPDTDYIFTDENKKPSRESLIQIHVQHQQEPVIKTRDGKLEFKQPKRSSSPNIGQFQVLDVAVHPDILVKISPKHSPVPVTHQQQTAQSTPRSAQQRRRLLQRSHEIESGGSTSESEHNFETQQEAKAQDFKLQFNKEYNNQPEKAASPTKSKAVVEDASFDAAQKYFAESGILGPINTASPLIRKTSKILQDANVHEQIRKTSMILRANGGISSGNNTTPTTPKLHSPTSPKSKALVVAPSLALVPVEKPKFRTIDENSYSKHNNCNTQYNVYSMERPPPLAYGNSSSSSNNKANSSCNSTHGSSAPHSPHTMATTCGFSPNMTTKSCNVTDDRDAQIKSMQGEIVSLKDVIKARDAEIAKLRREIHKLKSVLQQTANPLPIAIADLPPSPTALAPSPNNFLLASPNQICTVCKRKFETDATSTPRIGQITPENSNSVESNISEATATTNAGNTAVTCALANYNAANNQPVEIALDAVAAQTAAEAAATALTCNGLKTKLTPMPAHQQTPVLKKQGVSGESCETSMQQSINVPIPKFEKDFRSKQLIKDAIMDNDFLKNIDASQVRELVESMYPLAIAKGEFVIREGEAGAHLYVSAEGEFEVVKGGIILSVMGPGKAFGELAILYNCTRTASIRVLSDARVWVLDRRVFQQIMMRTGMQRIENSVNFLKSVPLLKNLSMEVLAKIADVLEVEFYPAGTYIIRQGASGDTFFLISQGSVKVTQKLTTTSEEKEIRTLERGDYFGEQALINEDKRTANIIAMAPGVECLTLDRDSFTQLIGDLCELKEKNYGDENRVLAMKYAEKSKEIFGANVEQKFPEMKLTDLEVVATLGIGGFGRVELVKAYRENSVDIFALKCLKKKHIVDTKQEEHVFSERTIMLTCNSPFICRLYRTFRDEKYVYMLLEACMGGEIWTMLRDRGCFDDNATQFIIGCVLQAFEYLHSYGIIYRDLKPENLMLDERGYVKLVDFGFAKYIGNSSKTWTFCGTPEYVAPEIILNKGHDRAVDYWALGILIHELLNGTPPFTATDPMKTYNIILKGIDMIDFPKHMSRSAVQLIKKLCRDVPAERLGYQKGGIQNIKKHKWFLGFDWDGLEHQLLIPPFVRPIAHPTDTAYFDKFPCDPEEPPDEFSGWDADF